MQASIDNATKLTTIEAVYKRASIFSAYLLLACKITPQLYSLLFLIEIPIAIIIPLE